MPTFIPARGRTLHLAGVCVNRIGTERTRRKELTQIQFAPIMNIDNHVAGVGSTPRGMEGSMLQFKASKAAILAAVRKPRPAYGRGLWVVRLASSLT
jgi:hypothetical protein